MKHNEAQSAYAESTDEGANWCRETLHKPTKHASKYMGCKVRQIVPLVEFMCLIKLCLPACQVRVTVGDSGLCCVCATAFKC